MIFEPSVHLVGQQTINDAYLDRFLAQNDVLSWDTDTDVAAEKLVEVAGRVCYMSFAKPRPGGNHAYIEHLLEVGHGSVLEHAVFNLIIEGVSRSLTHELVRHRAGTAFSQLSQRYVDESQVDFVVPPLYAEAVEAHKAYSFAAFAAGNPSAYIEEVTQRYGGEERLGHLVKLGRAWTSAVRASRSSYKELVELSRGLFPELEEQPPTERRKAFREAARSVLPNATETKLFFTANARAMRHFLEMRGSLAADAEIRRLALAVHARLVDAAPELFGDFERKVDKHGRVYLLNQWKKV
jgi:thymidylate synthase (FAD)